MNERKLEIYLNELLHQIESVHIAARIYNESLSTPSTSNLPIAFAAVQSFLSAVAMISKLLWPKAQPTTHVDGTSLSAQEKREARERAESRGATLRRELGESEVASLTNLQSKEVRNGLEHFDERLDQYLHEAGDDAAIIDRNIAPAGGIVVNGDTNPLTLRHIDNATHSVSVLGDRADMQKLMSAVDQLANLCERRLSRAV